MSKTVFGYMFSMLFVSMALALFLPVTALYLADDVHASKFQIGMFFTVQGLFTIILSQFVARYSDIYGGRKPIIIWGSICGALTCLVFTQTRNYSLILLTGAFIYSMAQIGSQLFASAREDCIYSGRNVYTFTSILRVFFALAWVIGPPAALYTVGVYGFNFVYYANIAVYALVITAVVTLLPNTSQFRKEDAGEIKKIRLFSEPSVAFLCLTTVCVFVCNNMYLITMPQYVTKELDFPIRFVGIFVAAAAAMEMPIMVISSQLARRISMKYIILFGLGCGVVFGALVPVASTVGGFIAIQIVNALFIGIYTTLGMLYFQELMPKIPGQSTTLFTSSIAIGSIAAGGISGIIAESLGYVFVFYTNIIVSLLGFISMSLVRKI